MAKICFVSYEIHPTTAGGCGVLLHHSARFLLEQGFEVVFLLDMDARDFVKFDQIDRLKLPNAENCRAYLVTSFLEDAHIPHNMFKTWFEYRAYIFYIAARQIYHLEKPDIFEFFEYCGVAYHALSAKVAGLDFQESHLAVRLHNSLELIDREQPDNLHGLDRYIMYGLEHQSLRLAESVLYPSRTFLEAIYHKHYEPWFGNQIYSQPALLDYPQILGKAAKSDGILFLGRLFGFKGVDRFVDAAVLYLSKPGNLPINFYFVGYDSLKSPTDHNRYQDYLLSKVPESFRKHFIFLGQISWQKLGLLLPRVLFAVIPSYLESFCYAAHELYEAGVPLIVADIPAFQDSFNHNMNALVFDGTVNDLAEKMTQLSSDSQLRDKIRKPYSIDRAPLGDFYTNPPSESWMQPIVKPYLMRVLILIFGNDSTRLTETLESIKASRLENVQIVRMVSATKMSEKQGGPTAAKAWFLGQQCIPYNLEGATLAPTEIMTSDALILLKSGDLVDQNYLPSALEILGRLQQISFVGCWQHHKNSNGKNRLDTLPYDCMLEALPYLRRSGMYRFVMRTQPGQLLIDLFDSRAGPLGELAFLWGLETSDQCGILIPEFWITYYDEHANLLQQPYLDYLVIQDDNPMRKEKLARLHLSLRSRERVLRRFFVVNRQTNSLHAWIVRIVRVLAISRLSKWADQYPWIKNSIRAVVAKVLSIIIRSPKNKTV